MSIIATHFASIPGDDVKAWKRRGELVHASIWDIMKEIDSDPTGAGEAVKTIVEIAREAASYAGKNDSENMWSPNWFAISVVDNIHFFLRSDGTRAYGTLYPEAYRTVNAVRRDVHVHSDTARPAWTPRMNGGRGIN